MTPGAWERDATTRTLLDAAREELLAVGQAEFAMEGVARRGFYSIGSVYSRWPDRESLLRDLGSAVRELEGIVGAIELPVDTTISVSGQSADMRDSFLASWDVQRQGWMLAEHEWEEVLEFLEQQQLIASTGSGTWVLSRDLGQYTLAQLLSRSPWPLPRLAQLPEQLDEPWYPALREGMERMQAEREEQFGVSLADWLPGKG